jgi:hypothetical protein
MTSIHAIRPGSGFGSVALDPVWTAAGGPLGAGYTSLLPVSLGDRLALFAHDRAARRTDAFTLGDADPWVRAAGVQPDLDHAGWDSLSTFVLGNEPYLMAYERQQGKFAFFRVAPDLSVSKPYSFAYLRNTPTAGFTAVAPYTSLGQVYFTGYNFDDGTVANFSLAVTSTSAQGVPPLQALNVWYHHWAKGWTRFAFFQLGGANFFFKINTAKLNVNIDHMQDDPAQGSVEVGSYLQGQLPDALDITHAAIVPWADGEPVLLTYIAPSGRTAVYRIHADAQGWTRLGEVTLEANASQAVTYRIGGASFLLLYGAT